MAALEARSLLTCETFPSPDARYPLGVGGIVRMVGGLRLERRAPSPQNAGRLEIGMGGRNALESASARFRRKHVAERWAAKALPPYAATTHALRHSRQTSHSSTLRPSFAMATACLALANARRNECPDLFSDGLSPSVGVYLPTDGHPGWGELYTPTARQARTWSRTVLTRNVNFRSVDLTLIGDVIC